MKTNLFTTLAALALIVNIAFPNRSMSAQPTRKITYKTVGGMELKLHIFDPPSDTKKPMPAVVFFFGGGWKGGSPDQFYHQSKYLSQQGMLAISAEYRTQGNGRVQPSECVKDGKAAIRYVRAHAKELGIDPDRIASGGGSAGGHVGAATGTVKGFEHDDEDKSISSRPNAMILFNPVYDNSTRGYGNSRVKDYWKEFSPLHNIDKDTPPAIVFFGSNEKLVKRDAMDAFKKKMEEHGAKSILHVYEGPGHGFFNHGRDKNKWFIATLTETHKFLVDLGWISGEPKVEEYVGKKASQPASNKDKKSSGKRVSIFDGKTLKDWTLHKCKAEVSDGDILITEGNGMVQSEKKYKDFVLEFDWKKLAEQKWDSGVYFRYKNIPKGRPWPGRYQANLKIGQEGNVGGIKGAKSKGLIKPEEWNKFKLTVQGSKVSLEINGKKAWDADGLKDLDAGYIGIQAEVPMGGKHRFRNIYITEL